MRKQIAAVAVAALLVFAGCSAGGNGGATTAPETTAGAPGDPVYDSPLDAQTVAQAHESVVRDAGTFTLVSTSNQTQAGQSSTIESSTAVDLSSGAYFATQEARGQTVEQFGFGNGTAYQRVTIGNDTQYTVPQRAPNTSQLAGSQLESFLVAFSFSYTGTETTDGTETYVYEASGVEDLNQSAPGFGSLDAENVTNLSASVRVTDDGLVKQFGYSLAVSTGSGEVSVTTDQRYVDVGSTTVSEPAWLDEARANTNTTA